MSGLLHLKINGRGFHVSVLQLKNSVYQIYRNLVYADFFFFLEYYSDTLESKTIYNYCQISLILFNDGCSQESVLRIEGP